MHHLRSPAMLSLLLLALACWPGWSACGSKVVAPDGNTTETTAEATKDAGTPDNKPNPRPDTTPDVRTTPDQPTKPDARTTPDTPATPDATPDKAPEPTPDATTPEPQPELTPEPTPEPTPEVIVDKGSSKSPITASIVQATDVVTSYLLSGSSWNYFHGKTVNLGRHSNVGNTSYFTAFRFQGIDIPQGATITKAHVSWMPHNEVDSNNRLSINIYAEKAGNSAAYNPADYTKGRPDQRLKTTAKIDRWVVRCRDDCSSDVSSPKYEYDCPQRKLDCWDRKVRYQCPKDLKAILQEVFAQPTWKRGQALSVFLFNAATDSDGANYKDSRTLIGYDTAQPKGTPQLTIHFTP